MKKTIYKGVFHSFLPEKGYGFITPAWAKEGTTAENIFFYKTCCEPKRCFITALGYEEARTESPKKGHRYRIFFPKLPQTLYFTLKVWTVKGQQMFKAIDLRDANHVTEEEKAEADRNIRKPSFEEILHPSKEEVVLTVDPNMVAAVVSKTTEEKAEAVEEKPVDNKPAPQQTLSIYTEEELRELEEEEEDVEDDDEEEIDYDEYDDYYDD